ncbi:MAG: hypothetical protein JST00_24550 [Deltaproteobacteria bacterium]|nr:hypothetical protein [Deltaproteobacteria bacterium]
MGGMNLLRGALSAFFLFGAACHDRAIDDHAEAQLAEARSSAERAAVYPTCKNPSEISAGCGLVLKRASTEDFRVKFREKKCAGRSDAQCEALFQRMLDAWLVQRYGLADFDAAARTCDADPGRCDDPAQYELLLLDSHNKRVREGAARAELEIEAARRAAHQRDAQEKTAVVGAAIDLATSRPAPRCRAYPTVVSGVTTVVCAR